MLRLTFARLKASGKYCMQVVLNQLYWKRDAFMNKYKDINRSVLKYSTRVIVWNQKWPGLLSLYEKQWTLLCLLLVCFFSFVHYLNTVRQIILFFKWGMEITLISIDISSPSLFSYWFGSNWSYKDYRFYCSRLSGFQLLIISTL